MNIDEITKGDCLKYTAPPNSVGYMSRFNGGVEVLSVHRSDIEDIYDLVYVKSLEPVAPLDQVFFVQPESLSTLIHEWWCSGNAPGDEEDMPCRGRGCQRRRIMFIMQGKL